MAYLGTYDLSLVFFSLLTAIFSSFMALELSGRISHASTLIGKVAWLTPGALALGGGVWTMHFIGMLAFSLPCGISYDPLQTLLSMVPGVMASAVALWGISRPDASFGKLGLVSVLMGAGIGTMHYSGMAAMRLDAIIYYSPAIFSLSIGFAIALSFMSLYAKFFWQQWPHLLPAWGQSISAAVLMGVAISGMHYIAMEAAYFIPVEGSPGAASGISPRVLALAIGLATLLLVSLTLAGAILGRHMETIDVLKNEIENHAETENILRESEERLRDYAESSSDWFWEMGPDLRFSYLSSHVVKATGVPVDFHLGKTREELAGEATNTEKWQQHLEGLKNHQAFNDFEYSRSGPDGNKQYLSISGSPLFDEGGNFLGYRGTGRDISDQKRAKDALLESEERYELAVSQAAIWDWNIEANKVFFSPLFKQMLGYSTEEFGEILENSVKSIVHPDDVDAYSDRLANHLKNPHTLYESEHRFRLKTGEYNWFQARGQCVCDAEGKAIRSVGLLLDISKRKAMDKSLQEVTERARMAEQRLVTAIQALDDAFVLYDAEDRLVLCNDRYREFYEKSADLIVKGNTFREIIQKGAERGQYIDAVGRIDDWVSERMKAHRAADSVVEQLLDDGRWLKIAERKTPDGGTVGFRVDVTELKMAQEAAEQANKAKSEFLASMSHELRTPLNAVLGFAQMLLYDPNYSLEEAQKTYADSILEGGNHLLELINEILDLSKVEADQLYLSIENVNANEVVSECIAMNKPLGEHRGINIVNQLNGDGPNYLRVDRLRMKQVLINLLSNAIKYNRENGFVRVEGEKTDNGFLRISVIDTGVGIAQDDKAKVFQMFHRLGANSLISQEGTGIGLTVTKLLVEKMDGRIGFDSEVGVGSTFWLELPLAVEEEAAE